MSNIIDISARLESVIPQLKFSEDEVYEINDNKNAILKMQQKLEKGEGSVDSFSIMFEEILGKEAVKKIEEKHPGATSRLSQMTVVAIGIMAGIHGISYEEAEKQLFRD